MEAKYIVGGIIVVALIALYANGNLDPYLANIQNDDTDDDAGSGPTDPTKLQGDEFLGDSVVSCNGINKLNSSAFTCDTDWDVDYLVEREDGTFRTLVSDSSGTATVPIDPEYEGVVLAQFTVPGNIVYLDAESTVANNAKAFDWSYKPTTPNGQERFLIHLDVTGLEKPDGTGRPFAITWDLYGFADFTVTAPAAVTGLGAGESTTTSKYTIVGNSGDATAVMITDVEITLNGTDRGEYSREDSFIKIPWPDGIETLRLIDMERNEQASNTVFLKEYATTLEDAVPLIVENNAGDTILDIPFTLKMTCNGAVDGGIQVTIKFSGLDPDRSSYTSNAAQNFSC